MSAIVVSQHFGCTQKTIKHLQRQFRVTGNVADPPQSGRPCVTAAADDRYIILQHLRLSASECSSNWKTVWYSSTDCQKSVETKCSTYFCVLWSNSNLTSSNSKARFVPPSPALLTCCLGFDFVFR